MDELVRQEGETLLQFARRRAEHFGFTVASAPTAQPAEPSPAFSDDLVPDDAYVDSPFAAERAEIDAVLGRMDIVDAYNKYCGKMHCDPKGKRESIMVRCPFPGHNDEHPSAWLSLDKGDGGVGNCPNDGGFDKYDMAAWHFNYDVPGYKLGASFPALRREMAEGLGYTVMVSGKDEWLEKTQPASPVASSQFSGEVVQLRQTIPADDWEGYDDQPPPLMDWRTLPSLAHDGFLRTWMLETSRLHQPEEFYLFTGFAALALAVGNAVVMDDEDVVRSNMMICLVGGTGTGKSRAVNKFLNLLYEALPYHDASDSGVTHIHSPGSGEDLVNQFINRVTDPVTKEVTVYPVRGLVYEDEFEGLMAKVNRASSTLRANLMKFYDSARAVSKSSQTAGSAVSTQHFMEVLTTTQPKRLSSLMTAGDASSGFLNRWIFVFGTEKFRPSISDVRIDVKPSADALQSIRAWSSPGRVVQLDADPVATQMWDELVQNHIRKIESSDNLLASRIELQCKKLLLIFAVNEMTTIVNELHMTSLILLFPYLKQCYGIIDKNVGKTDTQECIDVMTKFFFKHQDEDVTMRMLSKNSGAKRFDDYTRSKAIELMLKNGAICEAARAKSEKVIRWRYVPEDSVQLATVTSII